MLKALMQKMLKKANLELNTITGRQRLEVKQQLYKLGSIAEQPFRTIIDVGANEGQFSSLARAAFPKARIIAFEPIPHCFATLQRSFQRDKNFEAYNVALGCKSQIREFHVNEFTATSSFLPLYSANTHEFSETGPEQIIPVTEKSFEELFQLDTIEKPYLLKIDVQGYELEVLKHNEALLGSAHTVLIETSYINIYIGQPLFAEVFMFLHKRGFLFSGNFEQLRGLGSGVIIQADAIFKNSCLNSKE